MKQLAVACLALLANACTTPLGTTEGQWNYDLPDRRAGVNLGVVTCPAPAPSFVVPQIGSITFRERGDGLLEGVTDQGCTWTFALTGDTAALSPSTQTCFNEVIGSSYSLQWTVTFDGDHASEHIEGTSHLPTGDCSFVLADGRRTRVASATSDVDALVGTLRPGAPDPATGTNLAQVVCGGVAAYRPSQELLGSSFTARRNDEHHITLESDFGCTWQFAVEGNTAELVPGSPPCVAPDGTVTAIRFWSMATDGTEIAVFASGMSGDCFVLIASGSLSRE